MNAASLGSSVAISPTNTLAISGLYKIWPERQNAESQRRSDLAQDAFELDGRRAAASLPPAGASPPPDMCDNTSCFGVNGVVNFIGLAHALDA